MLANFNKLEEFKDVHYELMENTISIPNIIEKLSSVTKKLSDEKSTDLKKKYIEEFYKEVENWQIMVSQPQDSIIWMQIPMKYYEVEEEFTFMQRIKILIKEGIWIKPKIVKRYADMISNTNFPMETPLDLFEFFDSSAKNEDKFYYSVMSLIPKIVSVLVESDSNSIAIYERPYGVIAMNKLNYWINQLEENTEINTGPLKSTLEIVPFSDLIRDSRLSMNLTEEMLAELDELLEENGLYART